MYSEIYYISDKWSRGNVIINLSKEKDSESGHDGHEKTSMDAQGTGSAVGLGVNNALSLGTDSGALESLGGGENSGLTLSEPGLDTTHGIGSDARAPGDLNNSLVGLEALDGHLVVVALAALVVDAEDSLGAVGTLLEAVVVHIGQDSLGALGEILLGQLDSVGADLVQLRRKHVERMGLVVARGPEGLTVVGVMRAVEVLLLTLVDCRESFVSIQTKMSASRYTYQSECRRS